MKDKIYCGSGKRKESVKGIWLKCTVNPEVLNKYIQEYEGNKFVKLDINVFDEPNQFGKDVSITIDTYKKEEKKEPGMKDPGKPEVKQDDDLPF